MLVNPGASMSDIAQAAGVGRATLYRHFETREQIIRELAVESLEMTDAALKPVRLAGLDARETFEQGLIAVMQVADRYHFLLALWSHAENDPEVAAIYQRQIRQLAELIERGKGEGSIDRDLSTEWIATLVDSLVYSGWWAVHSGDLSAGQAGRNAARVLFNGVSPQNSSRAGQE